VSAIKNRNKKYSYFFGIYFPETGGLPYKYPYFLVLKGNGFKASSCFTGCLVDLSFFEDELNEALKQNYQLI